jgi:hypothetical protein
VAKRRRCKDKVSHDGHDWGQQSDGGDNSSIKAGVATVVSFGGGRSRMRAIPQNFWCPGRKVREGS